jgi:CubicO group peptidase (beta-lactamase class C family)
MYRLTNTLLAILLVASALLSAPLASAQQTTHTLPTNIWPTRGWAVSSPEEQGMSSERLARLVEFGAVNDMDSVLVTRHGRIVLEATYAPFRPGLKHHVYSATKSVTSTLVGMALGDGLLDSTGRKVVDFFPDHTIAKLDDAKKAITVQHLLDMTSGLSWTEGLSGALDSAIAMARSPDWQQFVLDQPMAAAPGTRFYYNSGNSHLLSAILGKVTGRSANDYAREKLFGPLGIDDVQWQSDPQGVTVGGWGLHLQPRDMAKIGYLWLRGGLWEAKQILPASWIEGVRKADIDMRESWAYDLRYGRQFWLMTRRDAFMAVGKHRQLIIVMPRLDIVAVVTGAQRFVGPSGNAVSTPRYGFETLVSYLAAAVTSDGAVAAQPTATAELAERVKAVAIEQPAPTSAGVSGAAPAMAKAVSGKTWRFTDGDPLRLKSLTLKLDDAQPSYEYELGGGPPNAPLGRFGGPIGFDGRFAVGGRMPYGPSAARGAWSADGASFVLEVQALGNDDVARVTHVFGDKTIELSIESASGFRAKAQGRAED